MDGLDLSQIKPLTEAEAEAYFNQPTPSDKFHKAIEEVRGIGADHLIADIEAYVRWLLQAVNNANERYDGIDRYLNRHHDMGQ